MVTRWGTSPWLMCSAVALVVTAAFLLLLNLGDRALWDDEAQTAVLGRFVLQHGIPIVRGTDNIPTDLPDRSDFNQDGVFIWNTWLPHYLVAASFGLLGESEFAARLPFAFAGAAAILLVALAAKQLAPDDPWYPLLAALFLVLAVPFLLHVRQCRYYALAITGTVMMVYGYLLTGAQKRSAWIYIAAGGMICFYSFYVIAAVNGIALLLHSWWRGNRHALRELGKSALAVAVAAAPAVIYMRLWDPSQSAGLVGASKIDSFWVFLLWVNGFVIPFPVILAAAFFWSVRGKWLWAAAYFLFLVGASVLSPAAGTVLGLGILLLTGMAIMLARQSTPRQDLPDRSGALTGNTGTPGEVLAFFGVASIILLAMVSQYPFYRYLVHLVPLAALFIASVVRKIMLRNAFAAVVLAGVLLLTNIISATPLAAVERLVARDQLPLHEYTVVPRVIWRWTAVRADLVSYLHELTNPVVDPEACVAAELVRSGQPGDIIKASYGTLSLMYYVPAMRVVSRHSVGEYTPDVVIIRGPYPLRQDAAFLQRVAPLVYTAVELPCPDVIWSNNPDPLFHRYRMPVDAHRLKIYRRG